MTLLSTTLALALSTTLTSAAGLAIGNPVTAAEPSWCPEVAGHTVECGTLNRPLVQGRPTLGTVGVGYARILRRDRDQPARGTILVNPGGPGDAAIQYAEHYAKSLSESLSDHDLLLVDPRGIGNSTPLECGMPGYVLVTETRNDLIRLVGQCGRTLGPRAEGYTSAATADDFDAVRAELNISDVVLYGQSYGTYLMPIYAQRHPAAVRSIVLSGAYPLDFDSLGRNSARAVSLTLRRICERSKACDGGQAVRDLAKVAARLRTAPVKYEVDVLGERRTLWIGEDRLAALAYSSASRDLGATPGEVPLAGLLPRLLHRSAAGDDRELIALFNGTYAAKSGKRAGTEQVIQDAAQPMAVACNDYPRTWPVNVSPAERSRAFDRAVNRARPGDFGAFGARGFARAQADGGDLCLRWPAKGTGRPYVSTGRFPDVPVLVLSGDLDANTPDANGREAAAQFRGATLLSVPNTGHVPENEPSGCVTGVVNDFIRDGRVGETACLAAIPPVKVRPVR